jgi:hypothetical protein
LLIFIFLQQSSPGGGGKSAAEPEESGARNEGWDTEDWGSIDDVKYSKIKQLSIFNTLDLGTRGS